MLIEHEGKRPRVHPSAYVAPTAVLCGDVEVGEDCRILFGAVLVAVGDPARILPPDRHEEIWEVQRELDFPRTVYGVPRSAPGESAMEEITRRYVDLFGRHGGDRAVG